LISRKNSATLTPNGIPQGECRVDRPVCIPAESMIFGAVLVKMGHTVALGIRTPSPEEMTMKKEALRWD
jgi:hypothetical protein